MGYARSIADAREMTAREVIQALNYEVFCGDYEREYMEINRNGP
jgi:hypothetical protein